MYGIYLPQIKDSKFRHGRKWSREFFNFIVKEVQDFQMFQIGQGWRDYWNPVVGQGNPGQVVHGHYKEKEKQTLFYFTRRKHD